MKQSIGIVVCAVIGKSPRPWPTDYIKKIIKTKGTPEPTMTNIKIKSKTIYNKFTNRQQQRLSLNKKTNLLKKNYAISPRALLSAYHVSLLHVMRCKQKKTSTRINNRHYAIILLIINTSLNSDSLESFGLYIFCI